MFGNSNNRKEIVFVFIYFYKYFLKTNQINNFLVFFNGLNVLILKIKKYKKYYFNIF
jgi:hypothetical protein